MPETLLHKQKSPWRKPKTQTSFRGAKLVSGYLTR